MVTASDDGFTMGEFWGDVGPGMRADSKAKRASNREWSAAHLTEKGIKFDSRNDGAHLIVRHNGKRADFWPGTGKWIIQAIPGKEPQHGRGVRGLVARLGSPAQ